MQRTGAVSLPDVDLGPLKKSWDWVNRQLGTGANLDKNQRVTADNIRTNMGQQELHAIRTESALKPFRETMEKWTPAAKAQWVDQIEAGQPSPDPKLQPAADLNASLNEQNIKEGKQYGLNTTKWDGDWIGRLATFPDEAEHNSTRSTIAGRQNFLKGRSFDTFSDFKNFVESHGGRLMYDNPMDMLLAKQMEVRRSIDARKAMYGEEDRKMLKWVPDGEAPPANFDARLDDRLAKQERPVIAPKQLVARLAQMPHFDGRKFIDSPEWQNNAQMLRPGDTMPDGYAYTGETKRGQYAADPNVAGLFNNLISGGLTKDLPILKQIIGVKRAATAINLALPTVHATLESFGNVAQSFGRAIDNAAHGEWDLAAKNAARMNPGVAGRFGRAIREQATDPSAHPELEPLVQTSVEGGNKFNIKSVLNKTSFQKAADAWKEADGVGAALNLVKAVHNTVQSPVFEHFIPDLRAAGKAAAAETALRRGLSGEELRTHMAKAQDDIDNVLGTVIRTHQFQNKVITDVMDAVMLAPKFVEGTFRFAGATARDTALALRDVAQGKSPKLTPAMYTAVGGVLSHAIGAALTQMVYTKMTTGKSVLPSSPQDYFAPQTGRVDAEGRPQRLSLLSPFSALFSFARNAPGAAGSRVASLWRSGYHAIENQDEHGVQVRNPDDSGGKQAFDTAKYMVKENAPIQLQNFLKPSHPGQPATWDTRVGEAVGLRYSNPSTSDAEKAAFDVLADHRDVGGKTQEQADRSAMVAQFANDLRHRAPDAATNIRKAVREGKLTIADTSLIRKRAEEPSGLIGLVRDSNIRPDELMERVWPKATDDEKRQIQWAVRGRVGRSESLSPDQKRAYLQQIMRDVRPPSP